MKKYIVITGIFKGLIFKGEWMGSRVWNADSIGQSFPIENVELLKTE